MFLLWWAKLMLFRNRYIYNLKLSQHLERSEYLGISQFGHENFLLTPDLKRLAFMSTERFGIISSIAGIAVSMVLSFVLSFLTCPELKEGETECERLTVSSRESLVFVVPSLLIGCWCVVLGCQVRKFPDVLKIMREIKVTFIIGFVSFSIGSVLKVIDAFRIEDSPDYVFDYGISIDFAFMLIFCYTVPLQVYIATKGCKNGVDSKLCFNSFVEDRIGQRLFRTHLINELSIENLTFYLEVKQFKQLFEMAEGSSESQKQCATEIYAKFLSGQHQTQVNISYQARDKIEKLLSNDEVSGTLFDGAFWEVYSLMQSDSYPRFKLTSEYKQFIGTDTSVHRSHSL